MSKSVLPQYFKVLLAMQGIRWIRGGLAIAVSLCSWMEAAEGNFGPFLGRHNAALLVTKSSKLLGSRSNHGNTINKYKVFSNVVSSSETSLAGKDVEFVVEHEVLRDDDTNLGYMGLQDWFPITEGKNVVVAYDKLTLDKMTCMYVGDAPQNAWRAVTEFNSIISESEEKRSSRAVSIIKGRPSFLTPLFFELLFNFNNGLYSDHAFVEQLALFISDAGVEKAFKVRLINSCLLCPNGLDDSAKKSLAVANAKFIVDYSKNEPAYELPNLLRSFCRLFLGETVGNSFKESANRVLDPETSRDMLKTVQGDKNSLDETKKRLIQWLSTK